MKTKRGQIANVFIYVISVVIISIILIMGYKFISGTKESISKTDLTLLRTKLTSDIKSISSDFGSSKKVSYSVPGSAELCLVDLDKKDEIPQSELEDYPLVKDSIESNVKKNAFLLGPSTFESYYIGNISTTDPSLICLKPIAGKVNFIIKGLGNSALILTEP